LHLQQEEVLLLPAALPHIDFIFAMQSFIEPMPLIVESFMP
jgi:hypothetical protein